MRTLASTEHRRATIDRQTELAINQYAIALEQRHMRRTVSQRELSPLQLYDTRTREKQSRALLLSSFFWTLGDADRSRLRRKMLELLDRRDSLADHRLILRAIDETWPATARPPAAQWVAGFYLECPGIANRPGAYGV